MRGAFAQLIFRYQLFENEPLDRAVKVVLYTLAAGGAELAMRGADKGLDYLWPATAST